MTSVPEAAIAHFEALHELRVTVHDFRGDLWPHLSESRFRHAIAVCEAVKTAGFERACTAFDRDFLARQAARFPDGFSKECHAGLVEWVVPRFSGGQLIWLFFAGVARASPRFSADLHDPNRTRSGGFSAWHQAREVGAIGEKDALFLEGLRQLAARLQVWCAAQENAPVAARQLRNDESAQRATLIRLFVEKHHKTPLRLAHLAEELGLSEARTGHVVRECCGENFGAILLRARLRSACAALRNTDFPVAEVARRCGFEDVRGFARVFRREIGETPGRYRRFSRA